MKMALAMLAVFATLITLIATVLVLAAFGLGKALSLVLPFSVFEASLLSMLALWPALWPVAHSDVRSERRHPTCLGR